jgi:hypothetical protein
MTRDQAEEIKRHLLDAAAAISRAEVATYKAGEDARKALADHFHDVAIALHWRLLPAIYQQFPELEPPAEEPTIDSELTWDEVSLPSSITEHDLDEMILALLQPQWRKMAMILLRAQEHCEQRSWPIEAAVVAARIQALADADRIDHQGDLRMWRFSEVRLKP